VREGGQGVLAEVTDRLERPDARGNEIDELQLTETFDGFVETLLVAPAGSANRADTLCVGETVEKSSHLRGLDGASTKQRAELFC
jgi:hypothetical protein